MSNPLTALNDAGQAVWLDFVSRDFLKEGGLEQLVREDGLTGVTSNPSIFEKAMGQGTAYDDSLRAFLGKADADVVDVYEHLAIEDIRAAADILRPVYDRLEGRDGYVSLEVSPYLSMNTHDTLTEARRLWQAVDRPNLMVKVPGTAPGVPAIRALIEDGINVNVTLLFSVDSYLAVAEAYLAGLEARAAAGKPVTGIASVASFFVSRIDAQIDKKIDKRLAEGDTNADALKALKGKVAIANAKVAYQHYLELAQGARWQALAAKGAAPQRLLWASTGVKNPDYPDTLYIDTLIGPETVNTMPPKTMDAFRDHGVVARTIDADVDEARRVLAETDRLGLDLPGITADLVEDGGQQFSDAADALLGGVAAKRSKLLGDALNTVSYELSEALQSAVDATLKRAAREGWTRRLWQADATLWTNTDEADWQGWLAAAQGKQVDVEAVRALADSVRKDGFSHAVLLGMGGSSLGPEVLARTLGCQGGAELHVLDSTDPAQIRNVQARIDLAHTLFIVSSKSGSTLEPEILAAYFYEQAGRNGKQFVAVTDPGSKLEKLAKADGYRAIFHGDATIGGRYSVLSVFGIVPFGIAGHDVGKFFADTQAMVRACGPSSPPSVNPGVYLGAVIGESVKAGRDKLTIIASPSIASIGSWLEQLLAESTGKEGKGVIPVDGEPLAAPGHYGKDRLFAYLRVAGDDTSEMDARIDALAAAGHPVVRVSLSRADLIGQEFFRWEVATAIAGAVIGIDPFDQPDVEASKLKTRALTDAFEESGSLVEPSPLATDGKLAFYGDASLAADGTAHGILAAHLARLTEGDYAAVLAYLERNAAHEDVLTQIRSAIREATERATVGGFGPRFLHSTGQAYKGGPNSGVFLQITADSAQDLAIPGRRITFGVVIAAQAQGDLHVLVERDRRTLRVHLLGGDVDAGLAQLADAVSSALA